jgi:hypothetical protein
MLSIQVVPEGQKNTEWCRDNIDRMIRLLGQQYVDRSKEELCYKLINGLQNESDFEYLTGKDEYRMPARIRFMPIIKPFFDLLRSTQESRPLDPPVYSVDIDSLRDKNDELAGRIVEEVLSRTDAAQQRLGVMKLQLQARQQQLQQAGGGQLSPQDQLSLQMMSIEMDGIQQSIQRGEGILDDQVADLERRQALSARTQKELVAQDGLRYLIRKYDWKDRFDDGFQDLMTVDNEIYCIDDVYAGKDPSIRRVNPLFIYYLSATDANWIDECPGVLEKRWLTPAQVLDEYGHELSEADRNNLLKRIGNWAYNGLVPFGSGTSFNALPYGAVDSCEGGGEVYSGTTGYTTDMIEVSICEWRSVREVVMRRTREEEGSTYELVTEADIIPGETGQEKVTFERRYLSEWWGGVRIGHDIYAKMRKLPFQFRDVEHIGRSYGRYVGFAYNGMDRRPYSRVWAVKDVQILYNLVYYQMELLMALGGIKGVIVDKSQKPKDLPMEEWLYQFKQGMLYIDPTQPTESGRPSNYNQWATYDLSFGNGVAQCMQILASLEQLAGRIIGIPPQRLGEVMQQDQVGTHKQAIAQSNLTTETLFYKHQKVVARTLDRVLYTMPYAWAEGKRGQYVNGKYGQRIFQIARDQFKGAKFETFFDRFDETSKYMDQAMQAITMSFQAGGTGISQLIESFRARNLEELQESVKYYEQLAEKRAGEREQGIARNEQETARVQAEMDAMVKKQLSDGEQLKAQVDQMADQLDARIKQAQIEKDLQVAQIQAESKRYVADQNTAVEGGYLQQMDRKTTIEARLRALEIALGSGGNVALPSTRPKNDPHDARH